MAICMTLTRIENGEFVFVPANKEAEQCGVDNSQEHMVLEYPEYQELYETSIYAFMDPAYFSLADMQQIFVYSFSLPLVVFLVAWGYQTVIDFATDYFNH